MVDALGRTRRWVAPPDGCVIDLRPADVVPVVELVFFSGEVMRIGGMVVEEQRCARHVAADAALVETLNRGWFTVHDERAFPFLRYPVSPEELRQYIESEWRDTHFDAETFGRTVDAITAWPEAILRLREDMAIRTLRPRWD